MVKYSKPLLTRAVKINSSAEIELWNRQVLHLDKVFRK